MVVGDDDLEAECGGVGDLLDGGDAAVDGEHQLDALLGEPRQRLAVQAVALLEPRRQMPGRIGTELPQQEHGERGRADPVGVVVAVHADARARLDRGRDRRDGRAHVAEQERVVAGKLSGEEAGRLGGLAVAAADEHRGGHLVDAELSRQRLDLTVRTRCELPGSGCHRAVESTAAVGRTAVTKIPRKVRENMF